MIPNPFKTLITSFLVSPMCLCAQFASAQDTRAGNDQAAIAEIIVTAQKREQNLQKVPLAVTAISAAQLRASTESSRSAAKLLTGRC
jgi:iron complex outermembrane receptor protein